ncbi:MAG TPA: ABC transporter ATP-binding protein [Chloroflexota bacterium]|nr:ABC transporter ATP-binding protein [Chloroflexota bacterium]
MPKLETRGLSKTFIKATGGEVEALRDISLQIEEGEFICIVGASGCGKTTFLRILDGLIDQTSGEILLDGREVTRPGPDRGFVFQSDSLFPWRTVLDNVVFGLEVQGKPRKASVERAMEYIKLVGLSGFEKNYPHELSGGMRQRANLARALTVNPELLLMDEPFAALDAQTREIMQQELLRIWRGYQKTVIFITHQIDEAIYLADRVFVFTVRPGRVKTAIRVPFQRPRSLEIKRTPEFIGYVDQVWKLIEEEVRASVMAGES